MTLTTVLYLSCALISEPLAMLIMIATLFTGFWCEMWNFISYPTWFYTIPYVGFWKIFEMPLLGYGGYLFFGLIIWSYPMLVFSVMGKALPLRESVLKVMKRG